eukprot:gene9008-18648_t
MVQICVFASSSTRTPKHYLDASRKLGELIAKGGHVCVNGGGKFGSMGALNEGSKKHGGENLGVIHESFVLDGAEDTSMTNMIVLSGNDLSERKFALMSNCDAIIVLPGGVGTFDELWDAVSQKSLSMNGLENKPLCVLNYQGYYDGSLIQLRRAYEDGLLYNDVSAYFRVEETVEGALQWCLDEIQTLTTPSNNGNFGSEIDSSKHAMSTQLPGGRVIPKQVISTSKLSSSNFTHGFVIGLICGAGVLLLYPVVRAAIQKK